MPDVVGLLPAAGMGSRLAHIPTSKEIMPLGFRQHEADGQASWRVITPVEEHLLALYEAGATRCIVVLNPAKTDIMRYLGSGERFGLSLAYLVTPPQNPRPFHGMPFSLDLAQHWIGAATTLFAMPDTVVVPPSCTTRLAEAHAADSADLTLGLFPTTTPSKYGMVALDDHDMPVGFVDKPTQTDLRWMWGLAAWSPRFGAFLHSFLEQIDHRSGSEIVLSDVFAAATQKLRVRAIRFEDARYYDIGTPRDYHNLVVDLAHAQSIQGFPKG